MKKSIKPLAVPLVVSLAFTACGGTAPSKIEPWCGDFASSGGDQPPDNPSSCLQVLHIREAPDCGKRITADEVWTIDMQTPEDELQSQHEKAGSFALQSETPVAISNSGSRVRTILTAKKIAASKGCDLLIFGPSETVQLRYNNNMSAGGVPVAKERYYFVKMGMRES